jgi:hypothetical protein
MSSACHISAVSKVFDRSTNDAPAEYVKHHGQIEKPLAGRNISDIGHPKYVRTLSTEVPAYPVRRTSWPRTLPRSTRPAPSACPE